VYFFGLEKLAPALLGKLTTPLQLIAAQFAGSNRPEIIFDDKDKIFYELNQYKKSLDEVYQQACARGDLIGEPSHYFADVTELDEQLNNFACVDIGPKTVSQDWANLACRDVNDIRHDIVQGSMRVNKDADAHLLQPLANKIKQLHRDGHAVFLT